jgi:TrmH family RNA methyltransferase
MGRSRIVNHKFPQFSNSILHHQDPQYNQFLLTQTQRDGIDIVLVSPRNPLNIGAVARAMANFGFSRLAVVAPYAPHWREARSAIGAPELLQNATETESVAEAVADSTFVAGTGTLVNRKPEQPVLSLADAGPILAQQLDRSGRIALVFGPEKHGLTRDDLSFCNVLIEIPTDPRQPSMNLGQAVAVCLYELACRPQPISSASGTVGDFSPPPIGQEKDEGMGHGTSEIGPASSSGTLDRLAGLIEETMAAAGYSPRVMQPANRHDLRLLLRRLAPSALDTRRMLGLFRRILYRLNRSADPRSG